MASIDWRELARVLARKPWSPTDCPNFLVYDDKAAYRRYALGVTPLLVAGGARLKWLGDRVETLRGESPCDTFMLVRYRSHRAMIAMILLPYYQVINRWRLEGTRRLQLSFTEPVWANETLGAQPFALGVHYGAGEPGAVLRGVAAAAAAAGLAIAYASADRQAFSFLRDAAPNDPNPLQYAYTVFVAADDEASLRALAAAPGFAAALEGTSAACVQLYRRASPRSILQP